MVETYQVPPPSKKGGRKMVQGFLRLAIVSFRGGKGGEGKWKVGEGKKKSEKDKRKRRVRLLRRPSPPVRPNAEQGIYRSVQRTLKRDSIEAAGVAPSDSQSDRPLAVGGARCSRSDQSEAKETLRACSVVSGFGVYFRAWHSG